MPRTVWVLGFVSLFMDVSSEMIHALLPLFLTATLGASVALVGVIEGVAESAAALAKVFSGYLSDRMGRRKPLILAGYGLSAVTKPVFALAGAPVTVFAARFADRIGKGVRGAARDALIADVTRSDDLGRAYGLRQGLDTAGAFIGPLLAMAIMAMADSDMRVVFWVAVIPAALAVLCVIAGVREPAAGPGTKQAPPPIRLRDIRRFDTAFWGVVLVGIMFTLARFSEAFLVLRAHSEGLPLALAPLVLVAMNVVYALGAYPAGVWADNAAPASLLLWGLAALTGADLVLAFGPGLWWAFFGIGLWGVHLALTQGLLSKLVALHAPEALRGSAFGLFNSATGVTMLAASVLAGLLWDRLGPAATFVAGAGFSFAAALLVVGTVVAGRRA